ncbi:MAG TPA: nucleotidyl transferase AbiEii/AbiGii toxin family protein [Armatimonadota bacterium]|jgi:hypothetical protein
MKVSRERLTADADATGFRPEVLEKVIQLLGLLDGLRAHPFLKNRLALKGGTALNLFLFEVPRLSVDIDLNYLGSPDRAVMLAERPRLDEAISAVCRRGGFDIRKVPGGHAGGKWLLRYDSAIGEGGNLALDLNFMFRVPLWPVTLRDSHAIAGCQATNVPVLDEHELAAGKLAALLARHAARDLFDAHQLLTQRNLDPARLRLAFVVYGALNRHDWRTVVPEDVDFTESELRDSLIPVLPVGSAPPMGEDSDWGKRLVAECHAALGIVLPFTAEETEFLDRVLDYGEVSPELLTSDPEVQKRIAANPGLLWKAQNVREHRGLA